MALPRSERNYRVVEGWLAGAAPAESAVIASSIQILNHAMRRKVRLASQRANKYSANVRGVKKHQVAVAVRGVGAQGKALDRLQGFAMRLFAGGGSPEPGDHAKAEQAMDELEVAA
jgi:hypothetical protein